VEKLITKYYFQKRVINFLFNEQWYNRIKLYRIIFDFKIGKHYEISPIFKFFLTKDSIILDIGSNMGHYACRLNKIIRKGTGQIHCFEPVNSNFISLLNMKKLLSFKNATINKLGVSSDCKDAIINIPIFNNGLVIGTQATLLNIDNIKHKTEKINVTTIDKYVLDLNINQVNFIKCDTEGNEINVLEGAKETITKFLPILSFEMSFNEPKIKWLIDLGYNLFFFDEKMKKLKKIDDYQDGNLIFIHKIQLDTLKGIIYTKNGI